jgi:magnesium-transporting ATPase (P-type)
VRQKLPGDDQSHHDCKDQPSWYGVSGRLPRGSGRRQWGNVAHALLDAIALAVAAVPEGLPAVVTITLALGMHRMAKQRAIVKRLASVETLGSTTVICSDKTGTLTLNEMTVRAFYFRRRRFVVSGEGYKNEGEIGPDHGAGDRGDLKQLLVPLILCNDSRVKDAEVIGDPMEGALASRAIPASGFDASRDQHRFVSGLTFVGLIGFMDPPRPEARDAIAQCRTAGIQVKMITGDHKDTALAIARELSLEGRAITGKDLDAIDALDLAESIEHVAVFARVAPEHKVKIVRALQAKGHVVAMTGDGVNDAPALKTADIGVAMGISGTAVSKEAASMVLTDDNFATIVGAVRQGRALYDNIIKFIRFQMSTTIGAVLAVFFAPLVGLPEPFTPLQILWVAMIMDGPPAVSLALDAPRPGLMTEEPRPRDAVLLPFQRLAR